MTRSVRVGRSALHTVLLSLILTLFSGMSNEIFILAIRFYWELAFPPLNALPQTSL